MDYTIKWGLLTVGSARIECVPARHAEQDWIEIRVTARNNALAAPFYRVNNTVTCVIDPATGRSIRLVKSTHEGDVVCEDVLSFNRVDHTAFWESRSAGISTNYPVAPDTCDAVSFMYELRREPPGSGESREFRIAVDALVHGIRVTSGDARRSNTPALGSGGIRRFTVEALADGLFVNKIPEEIWISEGPHPVVTRMSLRVPLGTVKLLLNAYRPPDRLAGASLPKGLAQVAPAEASPAR